MKTTTLFIIMLCTALFSCKKDDDTPAASITGLWKGKYGNTTSYPGSGYTFLFRADGTVRVFDGSDTTSASKAEGNYFVTGTTVTTKYRYAGSNSYFLTTAQVDAKFTFIEGTWGSDPSTTNGGKYFLNKQ